MRLNGNNLNTSWIASLLIFMSVFSLGCAEGVFWRAGQYSPWAREQWAAEEEIADTLFERKRLMNESVSQVQQAPVEDQQKVAESLAETLHRDPILLLRLHSVHLLGQLNCPAAEQALADASKDHNSDIRIASIKSWAKLPEHSAIPHLQEMIGSDTNVDVRLAATRALGNFSGQRAVAAIALALDDPNPALQLRATESLQKITGEKLGRDVGAWQQYVNDIAPDNTISAAAEDPPAQSGTTPPGHLADETIDSIFR